MECYSNAPPQQLAPSFVANFRLDSGRGLLMEAGLEPVLPISQLPRRRDSGWWICWSDTNSPGPETRGTGRPKSREVVWRSLRFTRRRFESRRCPGLFLCGEMLDAFGPIGGHNFAWAWATGRAAGIAAARV
jgi:hypothetical protein